jgi:hypothetical protein
MDQNKMGYIGQIPEASAEGLTKQPMTLDEAAKALQDSMCLPRECSACHELTGKPILARCRADNLKQEIVISVSLSEIIGKLAQTDSKIWVSDSGKILFIRIKRVEQ